MSLLSDLTAAVHARVQQQQLRQLRAGKASKSRRPRTMSQRINDRGRHALDCIRELQVQARVLAVDPQERKEKLALLRRLRLMFRRAMAAQHAVHGNPPHRADDAQFRADCQRAMTKYGVTGTAAARVIVQDIAPTLSAKVREQLLRPSIWDETKQIQHLADRIRKNRTKASATKPGKSASL
jgi:hypothetical protein